MGKVLLEKGGSSSKLIGNATEDKVIAGYTFYKDDPKTLLTGTYQPYIIPSTYESATANHGRSTGTCNVTLTVSKTNKENAFVICSAASGDDTTSATTALSSCTTSRSGATLTLLCNITIRGTHTYSNSNTVAVYRLSYVDVGDKITFSNSGKYSRSSMIVLF